MIRYPGGKGKLLREIEREMPMLNDGDLFRSEFSQYIEPFVGAGAMARSVLPRLNPEMSVWLNDLDLTVYALWQCILTEPEALVFRIQAYEPKPEDFYTFKAQQIVRDDLLETAFRKVVLHQISFSGLGPMAGSPIGGRDQSCSRYNVGVRWNPVLLSAKVRSCHRMLNRFRDIRITCMDFQRVIEGADSGAYIYLDPPYVKVGSALYSHSMDESDHRRLAAALMETPATWLLSYDDAPLVRGMYANCRIADVSCTSAIPSVRTERRKNNELLVSPLPGRAAPAFSASTRPAPHFLSAIGGQS